MNAPCRAPRPSKFGRFHGSFICGELSSPVRCAKISFGGFSASLPGSSGVFENQDTLHPPKSPPSAKPRYRLKSSKSPEIVCVDHIIPRSVAPELDNVIANLELMPLSYHHHTLTHLCMPSGSPLSSKWRLRDATHLTLNLSRISKS